MKRKLAALSAMILASCASPTTVDTSQLVNSSSATKLEILDSRPVEQLRARQESDEISTRTYFDNKSFTPGLDVLLRSSLSQRLGAATSGKRLELKEFQVSLLAIGAAPVSQPALEAVAKSSETQMNSAPAGVALGYLAIEAANKVGAKKTVIVELAGTYDGVPFSLFHAESFHFGVSEANVRSVLSDALARLAEQLKPGHAPS